jgi:hypothetical protein
MNSNFTKISINKLAILLTAGSMLSACMKNSDVSPGNPPGGKGDKGTKYYSANADLKSKAASTSQHLGVAVKLKDDNDFTNEYNYHRILDLLARQQSRIHAQLGLLDAIIIDGTNQIEPSGSRYIMHLSFNISERDLEQLVTLVLPDQHNRREVERRFSVAMRPHTVSIVDLVGFKGAEIDDVAGKLTAIAGAVDFTNDATFTTLQLAGVFAIVPSGMLVNINVDADTIAMEIRAGIRARGIWNNEVLPVLRLHALNLSYQPGVFTPDQFMDVCEFTKRTASLIKGIPSTITSFVIGHRFNADLANKMMLLDYKATDVQLSEEIVRTKEPAPTVVDFTLSKQNLLTALQARSSQILKVEIDMPASAENVDLLKHFTEAVVPLIDVEQMNKLGYRVMQLTAIEMPSTQALLSIRLPASATELNYKFAGMLTMREFADLTEGIAFESSRMNIPMSLTGLVASQPVNKGLKDLKLWLSEKSADYLSTKRVQSVTVTLDSTAVSSLRNGLLTINLGDFSKERMERILK